jgi:hypothetical protein
MIRFYILVLLSVLLQGCNGRKRSAGAEEKAFSYPAAVVMPFAYNEPVQAEDAGNFTDYFAAALRERGFQINVSADAVADFSRIGIQGNSGFLRELAEKYEVEGIILGKLQKFSYRREGRSFVIGAEADVEVLDLHNGRQICQSTQKLTRRFRVRNARQTDFSAQNIEFLRQFTNALIGDLMKNWILQNKSPESETTVLKSESPESEEIESEETDSVDKNLPDMKIDSENDSGVNNLKERLESRLESLRENLSSDEEPEKTVSTPRWQQLQPSSERAPVISVRRLDTEPEVEASPSVVSVDSAQEVLDLSLPGFQLVYPLEFDPAKKYEKFYYLLERRGSQVAGEATVEDSVEENLVMEVFAAVNSFAVGRFLADYFQGVNPAPLSGIPEAFERNYLGKYQLGFMMGENAVIATGHRRYRSEILSGLSRFFENNGGISLQSVIQDVAAQAADIGRKNLAKSPQKASSVLPKSVSSSSKPPVSVKDNQPDVAKAKIPAKKPAVSAVKAKVPVKKPAVSEVKAKVPAKKPETSAVEARNPVEPKPPIATAGSSLQSSPPQFTASVSQSVAPVQLQETVTQPDARFFYNLGERYFHMQDYENAARFFADARKKGFRSPELQDFEQQLAVITGDASVLAGGGEEPEEKIEERMDIAVADFSPRNLSSVRTVVQTKAVPFAPAVTGFSSTLEYENTADDEEEKPAVIGRPDLSGTIGRPALSGATGNGLMDDFYLEMDKIEAELEKIKKSRQGLSTKGSSYALSDISGLVLKMLLLLGGCLAAFSFLSTKNIK